MKGMSEEVYKVSGTPKGQAMAAVIGVIAALTVEVERAFPPSVTDFWGSH